jgi:hypothetical protein
MEKSYVLVVENDVFYKINFPSTLPIAGRWIAGLDSNPVFVESTLYPEVCVGAFWHEENFYLPEDTEKLSPLTPLTLGESEDGLKIAVVTDGDIFGLLTFPMTDFSPIELDMLRMAFSASPIVIECLTDNLVDVGWTWDGVTFTPPTEGA